MPMKVNGKWDFSDLKEEMERIKNMSKEELDALEKEEEEYQRQVEKKLKEEEKKYGKLKWVR